MARNNLSFPSHGAILCALGLIPIAPSATPTRQNDADTPAPARSRPLVELSGSRSKIAARSYVLVSSPEEWNRLWQRHTGRMPQYVFGDEDQPHVDFDHCLVIAVFQGPQSNNLGVFADTVMEQPSRIILRFNNRWFSTTGKAALSARFLMPFGFFVLPRTAKEIVLEEAVYASKDQPPTFTERVRLHPPVLRLVPSP